MATVVCKTVQDKLKDTSINPESMFLNLSNHKCKLYKHVIITQDELKKASDSYKLFKNRMSCANTNQVVIGRNADRELRLIGQLLMFS